MPITIKTCINENRDLLGSNFANLGKTQHSFWGGHKICLSYNSEAGWKVVKLNIFQRFLRQHLGMYKDTRFEHVYEAWKKEKKVHADLKKDHPINKYMKVIWEKRYLIALGSSSPADAKVFCFAEDHTDIKFHKTTGKIIKALYRPGDIILIEGLAAGKVIQSEEKEVKKPEIPLGFLRNLYKAILGYYEPSNPVPAEKDIKPKYKTHLKARNLEGSYNVQGWEPKESMKRKKELFRGTNDKIDQLQRLQKEIAANLPKSGIFFNFTSRDLDPLKQTFVKVNQEFSILADYFLIDTKRQEEMLKFLNDSLVDLEHNSKNMKAFVDTLNDVFLEFNQYFKKAYYHHVKDADAAVIKKTLESIKPRNKVICQEIDKYRQMGKKVFVIGGKLHFITSKFGNPQELIDTKTCLSKHPFAIITKCKDYNDNYEAYFNPEYKEIVQQIIF